LPARLYPASALRPADAARVPQGRLPWPGADPRRVGRVARRPGAGEGPRPLHDPEVAVGNALAGVPPRGSVRAELPHTALTSGAWRRSERSDRGARSEPGESNGRRSAGTVPTTSGAADLGAEAREASCGPSLVGTCPG